MREPCIVLPTMADPGVFLSSTWEDLRPERKEVEEALHGMPGITFIGMAGHQEEPSRRAREFGAAATSPA